MRLKVVRLLGCGCIPPITTRTIPMMSVWSIVLNFRVLRVVAAKDGNVIYFVMMAHINKLSFGIKRWAKKWWHLSIRMVKLRLSTGCLWKIFWWFIDIKARVNFYWMVVVSWGLSIHFSMMSIIVMAWPYSAWWRNVSKSNKSVSKWTVNNKLMSCITISRYCWIRWRKKKKKKKLGCGLQSLVENYPLILFLHDLINYVCDVIAIIYEEGPVLLSFIILPCCVVDWVLSFFVGWSPFSLFVCSFDKRVNLSWLSDFNKQNQIK